MKPIIALMGRAQCGKDTIGQLLADALGGTTVAFADRLKEICRELFELSGDDVATDEGKNRATSFACLRCPACGSIEVIRHTTTQVECKSCTLVGEPGGFASAWTPRMILQHVGTEGIRRVDPDAWVRVALRRIDQQLAGPLPPNIVIITDCRFRAEADAVWRAGGQVWRVRRPSTDHAARGLGGHSSETEMDTIPDTMFQRVINNDGSLTQLETKVRAAALALR